MAEFRFDFLVIGSGIAGLNFARKAAKLGRVAIVTKRERQESETFYAQGGIASVLSSSDSFDLHVQDTLAAGCGLCHEDVVRMVVERGPGVIAELVDLGVTFSRVSDELAAENERGYDLGREGGHSRRRIVHAGDLTGREILEALLNNVESLPSVEFFEHHVAIDLITMSKFVRKNDKDVCLGAYVLDKRSGEIHTFLATATVLATGGAGKVYLYTSNPDTATGDGVAMAYRVGCRIANMEFFQFHPTCLYHPRAKNFLISEAVRGEGAVLVNSKGEPFMEKYHPKRGLATRDVVARAIDSELKASGDECVYLDITHKPAPDIIKRFPNIYRTLLEYGIDMTKEPIPVVPAAHYMCGGVVTDEWGETDIGNLFAIGEVAHTGLHGANRLASNSLLEGMVYSERAAEKSAELMGKQPPPYAVPAWDPGGASDSDEAIVISHNWEEVRRTLSNYVGVVRTNKRLLRAQSRIELLQGEISEYYWNFTVTSDLIELRNIATVAELIVKCALLRKESRGLHYNLDYPEADDENFKTDTLIRLTPRWLSA